MDTELNKRMSKAFVLMWNCSSDFRNSLNDLDSNTFHYLDDLMTDLTIDLREEINEDVRERHFNFSYSGEPFEL